MSVLLIREKCVEMFSHADLVFLHAPSVYDFRKHSILYGPVSDLVPSTPVFEMYPIGFTTMAEYLERNGLRVRIVNLAVRMLNDQKLVRNQPLFAPFDQFALQVEGLGIADASEIANFALKH